MSTTELQWASPPQDLPTLMTRVNALAGSTIADLAAAQHQPLPVSATHAKGWIGQLLESFLGTDAANLPEPDFRALGIELKSIPITAQGKPRESTYVCHIPLLEIGQERWLTSTVYRKLSTVLWIPIESEGTWHTRRIGQGFLWEPTQAQSEILRQDWEELVEIIALGRWAEITARYGQYLQVRPKGANAKSLCWAYNEEGERVQTLPRGFYLRTKFTQLILSTRK